MPGRTDVFITGHVYHVFNRTIDQRSVFVDQALSSAFVTTLLYYKSSHTLIPLSEFRRLSAQVQHDYHIRSERLSDPRVEVLAYCLMPTHFHLLLRQTHENGIRTYVSDSINSFTRSFNIRFKRKGPLFLPRFQSRIIRTDALVLHVSRYIHLNPYSGGVVQTLRELESYPHSSLSHYTQNTPSALVSPAMLLSHVRDGASYRAFVWNQAEYQKTLEELKYCQRWEG